MANPEHVAKLKEGFVAWNRWRSANPGVNPDLEGVDLTAEEFHDTALYDRDDDGRHFMNLLYMNLETAKLQSSNLQGVRLRHARLQDAALCNSSLVEADLREAKLQKANLSGAKLLGARLEGAQLEDADLSGVQLQGARMEGANLQRATLQWANLQGADLLKTDFRGADLKLAVLEDTELWKADLRSADLRGANLEGAEVTGVQFDRSSSQRKFQGIRVSTCYGSQTFKSFAQDQDYIEELRASGWSGWLKFIIWLGLADCGRSFTLWAVWSLGLATSFGYVYYFLMGRSHFKLDHLTFDLFSMIYYSIVTFTTLGFGDIKPSTPEGAGVVMLEVILGYIMLGGLISILANKLARRS